MSILFSPALILVDVSFIGYLFNKNKIIIFEEQKAVNIKLEITQWFVSIAIPRNLPQLFRSEIE